MPPALRRLLVGTRRFAPLIFVLAMLGGCIQRVAVPDPAPGSPAVATVPPAFFVATPPAPTATAATPFAGSYTLVATEALPPGDARAAYAAPLLQNGTRFVQITLRIAEMREPNTPPFAYELVTEEGVFGALASGEWEAAVASGATYRQDGVLLFVVPQTLREARLEIVEYAYPRPAPGVMLSLRRTVVATFALPRLP